MFHALCKPQSSWRGKIAYIPKIPILDTDNNNILYFVAHALNAVSWTSLVRTYSLGRAGWRRHGFRCVTFVTCTNHCTDHQETNLGLTGRAYDKVLNKDRGPEKRSGFWEKYEEFGLTEVEVAVPVNFVYKNDHMANRGSGMLFRWEVRPLLYIPVGE